MKKEVSVFKLANIFYFSFLQNGNGRKFKIKAF